MYKNSDIAIFALNSTQVFGEKVAEYLKIPLQKHVEERFPDTEEKVCPDPGAEGSCREKDVFVIQSLYGAPGDEDVYRKFVKLMMFNNAALHASAARITNVIPYLVGSRQDRKTKPREPLTGQMILDSLVNSGAKKIIGCTWHSPALQNALYIPCEILDGYIVLTRYLIEKEIIGPGKKISLVGPDVGALKGVIEPLYKKLTAKYQFDIHIAAVDKTRESGEKIQSRSFLMGDVEGRTALIFDDESVTGSTLNKAAEQVLNKGAERAIGLLAHCKIFKDEYLHKINEGPLERLIVTDTIFRDDKFFKDNPRFELSSVVPLFAEAIKATHNSESVSNLYEL